MEAQVRSRRKRKVAKTLETPVTNKRKRKRIEMRQARRPRRRIILSSSSSSSLSSMSLLCWSPSRSPIRISTSTLNEQEDSDAEVIEEPYDIYSQDPLASGDVLPTNTDVPSSNSKGADNVPPETSVPLRTINPPPETTDDPPATNEVAPEPELDPGLLEALGDVPDDDSTYGPNIHQQLAARWLPILRKGMPTEAKQKLLKEYTIPGNCQLLKAPKLNEEISGIVSQRVRGRDKNMQARQDQLGLGISAINRAMDLLLTADDKVRAVKYLSDGCRILSDLHFVETQERKKLITPELDKDFLSIIEHQDRDETLFGDELPAKMTAFKASLQIRKDNVPNASSSSPSPSRSLPSRRRSASPRSASSSRGRTHRVEQKAACTAPAPAAAAGPAAGDRGVGDVGSRQQTQDPLGTQAPDPALSARAQRAARRARTSATFYRGPTELLPNG